MNGQVVNLPTDEDRQMLREAVRGFLNRQWPVDKALESAEQPEAVREMWRNLGEQGLSMLGTEPSEGGMREILIVMEELGRASCPAPMVGAAMANIILWPKRNASADIEALLERIHAGTASMSPAFGAFDGDAGAGKVEIIDKSVSGQVNFIEGADHVTHLLVFAEKGPVAAVIDMESSGIRITATPGLAVPALSEISFDHTPAVVIEMTEQEIKDLNLLFRLSLARRAYGGARRAFELVTEYAKERKQFGQPIGRFQAIQHKLADCLTRLDGVLLTIGQTAKSHDQGSDDWRIFASAACAFASPALRRVSLETHHTFGAIGYAEEHEAPRHFRRVHSDMVRCGGVTKAREELAEYLLGPAA